MTIPEEIELLKSKLKQPLSKEEEAEGICILLRKYSAISGADLQAQIERLLELAEKLGNSLYKAWAWHSQGIVKRNLGEYAKALDTIMKSLAIFEELDYKNGIAVSLTDIGAIHYLKGDYMDALESYFRSLKIFEDAEDQQGISSLYNNMGLTYYQLSNYPEALKYHFASLEMKKKGNEDEVKIANSYNNIGNVLQVQGNYPEALKAQFEALKIRRKMEDKQGMARSYSNIGNIYEKQGKDSEALLNHLESLKLAKELHDKWSIALSYNNIGNHYQKLGNYSEALENHLESLKLRNEIGEKWGIGNAYANIGINYQYQAKYSDALNCYREGLKISEEIGDKKGVAIAHTNMGNVYEILGSLSEALNEQFMALSMGEEIGHKDVIRESCLSLYRIYKINHDYEKALKYYEKYHQIDTEMIGEESQKQLTNLSFQHNLEQIEKEAEITRLKNIELEAENSRIERETFIASKRAVNAQLDQHFIYNMLHSINIFILENKGDANDYISRFAKYVRGVLNRSSMDTISLRQEMDEIENYMVLEQISPSHSFSYKIKIEDGIDTEQIFIPPLIFHSLVENAIKHGFKGIDYAGKIDININRRNQLLVCTISDNGVGYKPGLTTDRKSFGLSLTQERIKLFNRQSDKNVMLKIEQKKKGVTAILTLSLN